MSYLDTEVHDENADAPAPRQTGLVYWLFLTMALLALTLLAAHVYRWFAEDAAQRRAWVQSQGSTAEADADLAAASPGSAHVLPALAPVTASAPVANEPVAPAVQGQTVYKCQQDDRLIYTNIPCPEGSAPSISSVVPSGSSTALAWSGRNQTSEQAARCGFLRAEVERLEYEFQQALPPPVLDHISTELGLLRQQRAELSCPGAASGAKAS